MSGISNVSAGSSQTVGTGTAPISFPGISSGIDYNSIVTKLTNMTLAPNTLYNSQITQLNAKNAELIKINNMFASVQSTLTALSDPATFNSYTGMSNDPADANISQIAGESASPGTYVIAATHAGTTTQITGASAAGVTINQSIALMCAGTAYTPTNGSNGQAGRLTVDGVAVTYDVSSQSLNTIVAHIYASVHAADAGFTISAAANGEITMATTDSQISIGAAGDNGNLAQVLKLDVAQIVNGATSGTVTSAGQIGGVNLASTLYSATNAGFATAVTSGAFTINGVQIKVDANSDNAAQVIANINNSTAGVVAAYDFTNGTFSLTNKNTGATGVVVGSTSDTSNFLQAAGLTASGGAASVVGNQAYVSVISSSGALHTTYSNSNSVAGAIPGMTVNVTGSTSTPFNVTISQNASVAISAITNFVSAYNAMVNEISIATAPPIVQQKNSSAGSPTATSTKLTTGGVLFGDQSIQDISNQLTQLVSAPAYNGNPAYNSLASIGLLLDSSHTVYASNTNAQGGTIDPTSGAIKTTQADGTSGKLQPLDIAKFSAAFAAQPSAVASLFTANIGLAATLGGYLTGVTGAPTFLAGGTVGTVPNVSLMQNDENAATAEITALNLSVKEVTDKANAQADLLRAQFTASEALISKYQSEQAAANQLGGTSTSSS